MASLAKAFNIADMAALAGRALPLPICNYLEGGADDEWTLARNRSVFDEWVLAQHTLVDVSDDGVVTVIGEYSAFSQLCQAVESMGITANKSGLQRLPNQPIELTEEQMIEVEAIIDKLEDDDDVQSVFTNLA